jgi:hypothetical protein
MSEAVAESGADPGGYDAFICYNGEDEEEARRLKIGLEAWRLRVFEASSNLRPGDAWMKEVSAAIASAKAALVLLGKAGAERWAELEVGEVLRAHQKRQMRIIPVLVPGAANDPDVPWLGGFTRVDLRTHYEAGLGDLRATLAGAPRVALDAGASGARTGGAAGSPIRLLLMAPRRVVTVAVMVAAALGGGVAVKRWLDARKQAELAGKLDAIVEKADWESVTGFANGDPLAAGPIDQRLLVHYRGPGTTKGVNELLELARGQPDEVCPLLANVVDLPARKGYPLLTVEEVLSQIVHSPCRDHGQVKRALASGAGEVRAALASPAAFTALSEQIDPRLDCASLERLRLAFSIGGNPACSAPAPLGPGGTL